MPETYRQAASVMVLRPAEAQGWELLLLHKPRKNDAWQLPQGGVEAGESVRDAALRELAEEAGISSCEFLGESAKVYQYDFPVGFRRFRPDNVKGQQIHFVFATVGREQGITVDRHEVDSHVWIVPEKLRSYVKRKEYARLIDELFAEATELLHFPPPDQV